MWLQLLSLNSYGEIDTLRKELDFKLFDVCGKKYAFIGSASLYIYINKLLEDIRFQWEAAGLIWYTLYAMMQYFKFPCAYVAMKRNRKLTCLCWPNASFLFLLIYFWTPLFFKNSSFYIINKKSGISVKIFDICLIMVVCVPMTL